MSFTDQKSFVATDTHLKAKRGGGFNCKLCGRQFNVGDTVRWVYANGTPGQQTGNFMVCSVCDGPDALERANASHRAAVALAKQWQIYGPDWEKDWQRFGGDR